MTTTNSDKVKGMLEYLIGAFNAVFGKKHSVRIEMDGEVINIDNTYELELIESGWVVSVWEVYPGSYHEPEDAELVEVGVYSEREAMEKVIDMCIKARLSDYNEYCFEKEYL
tara:strand:+ start:320 stop:655 length:336 start_codon:yes stop_codon:yes gene_type:complete